MPFKSIQVAANDKIWFFFMAEYYFIVRGFPGGASGKEPASQFRRHKEMWVQSLGWEDLLEEGMASHSSILARRIPWTEEPGGPQSTGSQSLT